MSGTLRSEHVEALRAHFTDPAEEQRLMTLMQQAPEEHAAYPALVFQAFREALIVRFPERFNALDIVRFVAEVRMALKDPTITPYVAEVISRRALGDQRVFDIAVDDIDKGRAQFGILSYVMTNDLDEEGREALIQRAIANTRNNLNEPSA